MIFLPKEVSGWFSDKCTKWPQQLWGQKYSCVYIIYWRKADFFVCFTPCMNHFGLHVYGPILIKVRPNDPKMKVPICIRKYTPMTHIFACSFALWWVSFELRRNSENSAPNDSKIISTSSRSNHPYAHNIQPRGWNFRRSTLRWADLLHCTT